jgi:spermidine synthase
MRKRLLFLSFVEGAAVMAAELCGAKLLAPVFGSSLFVWASVMGITLGALAGGYFFGGWLTTLKKTPSRTLFFVLSAAALFLLIMPVISYYVVPRISYMSFLPGVIVSTGTLLFLPVFFLGASSPLFILLQTNDIHDAGKVSGTVYAVSTLGGILATFFCGFYLIPVAGLNITLLIFGSVLLLVNVIVFRSLKGSVLFLFIGVLYFNYQLKSGADTSLMRSDSILGKLEVMDIFNGKDSVRILKINEIIQTEMNLKNKNSVSEYIQLLDTLIDKKDGSALVLGLGGGLTANMLSKKNYRTEGVEFDERIIEAAKNHFFLDPSVRAIDEDARFFLNRTEETYDVILADLFKAEEQPSHVLTVESLENLKKNLKQGGRIFVSWHGYLAGHRGHGTVILLNTFRKAGYDIKMCSKSLREDFRNIVFVASLEPLSAQPFELAEKYQYSELVNTDDLPRLEKFNAEANKAWRLQYLRYYQGL